MKRFWNCTTWWIHQKSLIQDLKGWLLCYEIISQLKQKKTNRIWALGVLSLGLSSHRGPLKGHIRNISLYIHECIHMYIQMCADTHIPAHMYSNTPSSLHKNKCSSHWHVQFQSNVQYLLWPFPLSDLWSPSTTGQSLRTRTQTLQLSCSLYFSKSIYFNKTITY